MIWGQDFKSGGNNPSKQQKVLVQRIAATFVGYARKESGSGTRRAFAAHPSVEGTRPALKKKTQYVVCTAKSSKQNLGAKRY